VEGGRRGDLFMYRTFFDLEVLHHTAAWAGFAAHAL
jgi:hypothetical protein